MELCAWLWLVAQNVSLVVFIRLERLLYKTLQTGWRQLKRHSRDQTYLYHIKSFRLSIFKSFGERVCLLQLNYYKIRDLLVMSKYILVGYFTFICKIRNGKFSYWSHD